MRRTFAASAVISLALALGACGGSQGAEEPETGPAGAQPATRVTEDEPNVPRCNSLFQPGVMLPVEMPDMCQHSDDEVEILGSFACRTTGKALYSIALPLGEVYGFTGDVVQLSSTPDIASDPGYKAAYEACV